MYKHGLETWEIEISSMSHMDDVIDISMSTFATMPTAMTIGGGKWGLCNHLVYSFLGMMI
jgi:hypothetical protein